MQTERARKSGGNFAIDCSAGKGKGKVWGTAERTVNYLQPSWLNDCFAWVCCCFYTIKFIWFLYAAFMPQYFPSIFPLFLPQRLCTFERERFAESAGKRQAASGKMRYRENAARGKCMVIIVMMTPTSDWRRGRFAFIKINCSQT